MGQKCVFGANNPAHRSKTELRPLARDRVKLGLKSGFRAGPLKAGGGGLKSRGFHWVLPYHVHGLYAGLSFSSPPITRPLHVTALGSRRKNSSAPLSTSRPPGLSKKRST